MKPLAIFYILVFYVILQFGWWAYLLGDLYKELFELKLQLIQQSNSDVATIKTDRELFLGNLQKKWLMIAGEGFVFLTLLFVGIRMINKAFLKEIRLTQQQKNFLLSITHEFKSPLAAIRLNLQTIQKHELDNKKKNQIIENSLIETDRVTNLVNNALIASQMESKKYTFDKNWFNLSSKILTIINKIPEAKKDSISIEHNIKPDIEWYGDADALESVIHNLLENSEKYAGSKKVNAIINLKRTKRNIQLEVIDDGIGIPDSEKENVFTAFYRVGNEETRKSKGTGLGLYITKYIVNHHQGIIEIHDNHPKGTIFKINFPDK